MVQLSIVILNYNASGFLELCIESVLKATRNIKAQIIVADNASTDDSLHAIEKYTPQIEILKFDKNHGFSKGNNLAVHHASGEFICLLNPDTVVGESVFDECYAFAKAQSQLGFIGIQLLDGSGKFLPESKRRVPTKRGVALKKLGFDSLYYDQRVKNDERAATDVLVGAFMFGRRKVYQDLGGLDERYFMYGEDIDLSFTALKSGYINWYLGDLKAIHFKGESTIQDKKYRERFYNAMSLFYEKHYPKDRYSKLLVNKFADRMINKKYSIKNTVEYSYDTILIVSNDSNLQRENTISFEELLDARSLHNGNFIQLIWDTSSLLFEDIIEFMADKKNNYSYRFLFSNGELKLGSDSSNTRGEVKRF